MPTPTPEISFRVDSKESIAPNDEIKFTPEQKRCMKTVDDLLKELEKIYTTIE